MSCTLTLRVQPGAKRDAVLGRYGESIRVSLKAPPVDGKANEELVAFLAEVLGVSRASVRLVAGAAVRTKLLRVEGLTLTEAEAKLLG